MSTETYTADQLHEGVLNAIHAHDVRAAVDILEALAAVDLPRAISLYGELQDALTVARVLGPGASGTPETKG